MIQTTRLTLRQLEKQDWPLFLALHETPSVIELCFDKPSEEETRAKFDARIVPWDGSSQTSLCFCVINEAGEKVGVSGFTASNTATHEVGYLFLPQFQGKGYATEALRAVIDWAKQKQEIRAFCAVVSDGNDGSIKVLEKCGFQLEKSVPNAYQIGGKLYTDHHFSLNCK